MAGGPQEVHRAGHLKLQARQHKTGGHRSKRKIKSESGGRRVSLKSITKSLRSDLGRAARRNQSRQIQKNKKAAVLAQKRRLGGTHAPPILVGVLSLTAGLDANKILFILRACDEAAVVVVSDLGVVHVSIPRFRLRFSFMPVDYGNLYGSLDVAKICDSLILLTDVNVGIDSVGSYILNCVTAQSLPTLNVVTMDTEGLNPKKLKEARKVALKNLQKRLTLEKIHSVDNAQEGIAFLRVLGLQKINQTTLKQQRPHILAEELQFELDKEESETGTLKVSGYVRGPALSVNSLVHLPGFGDFQMAQIDSPTDPNPLTIATNAKHMDSDMSEISVLEKVDPERQESLQAEAEIDPMDAEQTWPTEDELAQADQDATSKQPSKRVPKGTSAYQAAWIVDDQEDDDDDGDDDDDDGDDDDDDGDDSGMEEADGDTAMNTETMMDDESEDDESDDDSSVDSDEDEKDQVKEENRETAYDEEMDMEEEKKQLERFQEAQSHARFPDEVDTPAEQSARARFQKYRGLKSYRTSPWDPKENLPLEYARIFQFHNFSHTRRKVMSNPPTEGAQHGMYVTVHIVNVPKEFIDTYDNSQPLVLYGLLQHEQKMSVLHIVLKKHANYEHPIKSKERMIFHIGPRKFSACPIYSQHTNANKQKYERFFQNESTVVASIFAPITFPPMAVLMFKPMPDGSHCLAATGSVLSTNPDRIITKRTVLSGHPYKINKRHAVVRYMFFDKEDIQWFKPIELASKYGRRGHIKEALGTHGHMKCFFDKQLVSMDTILMCLYKRVFPKWTYNARLELPAEGVQLSEMGPDDEEEESDAEEME